MSCSVSTSLMWICCCSETRTEPKFQRIWKKISKRRQTAEDLPNRTGERLRVWGFLNRNCAKGAICIILNWQVDSSNSNLVLVYSTSSDKNFGCESEPKMKLNWTSRITGKIFFTVYFWVFILIFHQRTFVLILYFQSGYKMIIISLLSFNIGHFKCIFCFCFYKFYCNKWKTPLKNIKTV